jgi:hypothetical protein
MLDDIFICQFQKHIDPLGNSYCCPTQIKLGNTKFDDLLVEFTFDYSDEYDTNHTSTNNLPFIRKIDVNVQRVEKQNKLNLLPTFGLSEGHIITFTHSTENVNETEMYRMIIGTDKHAYPYFLSLPAIHNMTENGMGIYITFSHVVENFKFKQSSQVKIF